MDKRVITSVHTRVEWIVLERVSLYMASFILLYPLKFPNMRSHLVYALYTPSCHFRTNLSSLFVFEIPEVGLNVSMR